MNLYITKPGQLRRNDNTLQFRILGEEHSQASTEENPVGEDEAKVSPVSFPVESIDSIYVFEEVSINTKLLRFLAQERIPVHVFSYYGNHMGTYLPHSDHISGDVVVQQSLSSVDEQRKMKIAGEFVGAKLHNIGSVLGYYRRRGGDIGSAEETVRNMLQKVEECEKADELMGLEGAASKAYFGVWHVWCDAVEEGFRRVFHPPENAVNALLSFLNSLLYGLCVSEIYRTGLHPGISYLHVSGQRRYSLALDISEPFKPVMVDRLLFRLFAQNRVNKDSFRQESNGVLLQPEAKKSVVSEWDRLIGTTVEIPQLQRAVSYRQLVRLTCYSLIKHLLNNERFRSYRVRY